MLKRFSLIAFLAVFLLSVGGGVNSTEAAARLGTIYDGRVENIISELDEASNLFGLTLTRKKLYFCKSCGRNHYIAYINDSPNYIRFNLNDDNSVVYAYIRANVPTHKRADGSEYYYEDDLTTVGKSVGLFVIILYAIGMNSDEAMDMAGAVASKIDNLTDAEMEQENVDMTSYGHCSKTGKNIYLRLKDRPQENTYFSIEGWIGLAK